MIVNLQHSIPIYGYIPAKCTRSWIKDELKLPQFKITSFLPIFYHSLRCTVFLVNFLTTTKETTTEYNDFIVNKLPHKNRIFQCLKGYKHRTKRKFPPTYIRIHSKQMGSLLIKPRTNWTYSGHDLNGFTRFHYDFVFTNEWWMRRITLAYSAC